MNFAKNKRLGKKYFLEKKYSTALKYFSLAFSENPSNDELNLYILLASLAMNSEDEARAISEVYSKLKYVDKTNSYNFAKSLINSIEENSQISYLDKYGFNDENLAALEDGITYEDFKQLLKTQDGDFKSLFNNVIFSTRVVLTKKDDFFEFIEQLIKNGFTDMALNYIDSATSIFPSDERIRELLNLIKKIDYLEIPNK